MEDFAKEVSLFCTADSHTETGRGEFILPKSNQQNQWQSEVWRNFDILIMEQNVAIHSPGILGHKSGVTGVGILRLFRKPGICAVTQSQSQTKLLQKMDLASWWAEPSEGQHCLPSLSKGVGKQGRNSSTLSTKAWDIFLQGARSNYVQGWTRSRDPQRHRLLAVLQQAGSYRNYSSDTLKKTMFFNICKENKAWRGDRKELPLK